MAYMLLKSGPERGRRFNGHELVADLLDGVKFKDGIRLTDDDNHDDGMTDESGAACLFGSPVDLGVNGSPASGISWRLTHRAAAARAPCGGLFLLRCRSLTLPWPSSSRC